MAKVSRKAWEHFQLWNEWNGMKWNELVGNESKSSVRMTMPFGWKKKKNTVTFNMNANYVMILLLTDVNQQWNDGNGFIIGIAPRRE